MKTSTMHLFIKLVCFLSIFLAQPISSLSTNITLYNDAFVNANNHSISLTPQNCTPTVGRAFYANSVRFLDPSRNVTSSFSCNFTFTITNNPSCPFGNGIAFLITSNVEYFSLRDAYMGLPEEIIGKSDSYFAVEFRTSFDKDIDHVGVNGNGVKPLAYVDNLSRFGISLKGGKQISVWIEYDDSEKKVHVWVGYLKNTRPKNPAIALRVDLSKQFKEFMHVGFTAGNGRGSSIYTVHSWRFRPLSGVLHSGLPVEEGECLICEQDDVGFVKDHSSDRGVLKLALKLGADALAVVFITVSVTLCLCAMRRKRIRRARERPMLRLRGERRVPKMLSLNEIKSVTNGFNESTVLGDYASAVVHQGTIPSYGEVVVKKRINNFDSSRLPFNSDFGTIVGFLRHKNLVRLRGWCHDKNELVFVYEHLANGSLDKILHTNLSTFLTWERRMNIIHGVASALIYLHDENQIIHRDLKSSNILLDSEFNPKLGDSGLVEVCVHSFTSKDAVPAGTIGYLAPEYVHTGIPTSKTQVYSFGVLILEVASGRNPIDEASVTIVDYVNGLWKKGNICEAADPKLNGNFNKNEMERVLNVGLQCAHFFCHRRPTMKEAATMLRDEPPLPVLPLPVLPSKKPTARIQSVLLPEKCDDIMSLDGEGSDESWSTTKTHFSKY